MRALMVSALGLIGSSVDAADGVPMVGPFADAARATVNYRATPYVAQRECARMAAQLGDGIRPTISVAVPASAVAPAVCRITMVTAPENVIDIHLPRRWNGRLYFLGSGGPGGEEPDANQHLAVRARALSNGFATAFSNLGHRSAVDSGWRFMQDHAKLAAYGGAAVHEAVVWSRRAAELYYGREISHAYYHGCSTGGMQGLASAQRYPDDFDGRLIGAPSLNFSGVLLQHLWRGNIAAATPLSLAKVQLVGAAIYQRCDARDGLRDGLLTPAGCDFDVKRDVPVCTAGSDNANCLTTEQANAFAALYAPPRSQGRAFLPADVLGAEVAGGGQLSGWDIGANGFVQDAAIWLADGIMKDSSYDWRRFDLDDPAHMQRVTEFDRVVGARNPDLAAVQQRGGKILMYHGLADRAINPNMSVDYYEQVQRLSGPTTGEFFKLYLLPGMFHCAGGYGPDQFDGMSPLIDWVEAGKPPAIIDAHQVDKQVIERSRPLCAYPQTAIYRGGATNDARSFYCGLMSAEQQTTTGAKHDQH